jgi:dUTP pyrophosphatase
MNKTFVNIIVEEEEVIPVYSSKKASGADLFAYINEDIIIEPNSSVLVPTGVYMEIPDGYEVQIRPRSGLALKYQITVLNSPGTIDADYRGEVKVILINHGKKDFVVTPKMRIAQMVLTPVYQAEFVVKQEELLAVTERGRGGFGHTGI